MRAAIRTAVLVLVGSTGAAAQAPNLLIVPPIGGTPPSAFAGDGALPAAEDRTTSGVGSTTIGDIVQGLTDNPAPRKSAKGVLQFDNRGLHFRPADGLEFTLGGRAHLDFAQFDSDSTPNATQFSDEFGFRRLRVDLSGKWKDDWSLFVERDVGGTSTGWKEAWLRYKGLKHVEITAGSQIAPFGLDGTVGSNNTMFLEKALPDALVPNIYTGIAGRFYQDSWSVTAGYFGDTIDTDPKKHSLGAGPVARMTIAPLHEDGRILHIGASAEYRSVDAGSPYRIQSRPECGITDQRLLNTGRITDVNNTWTTGVEAMAALGSLCAQGEYIETKLERDSLNVQFHGWYAQASYLLTGERRTYNSREGNLRAVQPSSKLGALEAAIRLSDLDLQRLDITGGQQSDFSLGLNWYLNRNVRVMANYIWVDANPNRNGIREKPEIFELRLQVVL